MRGPCCFDVFDAFWRVLTEMDVQEVRDENEDWPCSRFRWEKVEVEDPRKQIQVVDALL